MALSLFTTDASRAALVYDAGDDLLWIDLTELLGKGNSGLGGLIAPV